MSRAAFLKADRARREHIPVSQEQRKHLKRLALKAGVEMPRVYTSKQASGAITRLEEQRRQPVLEGWR